jgi:acetyltransferase-like isoleucine patch superfamily enzyme
MKFANVSLGSEVEIDPSTSFNNVAIGDNVRIAKRCSIFGGPQSQLDIGDNSYIGMNTIINGFASKVRIGKNVSIAQNVNIMADSGPNASPGMQKVFPLEKGPVTIGNDCWIGASAVIMPNVTLGEFCIVAANSYVNKSFPQFSIVGGNPARLIRSFTSEEIKSMLGGDK